MSRSRSAADRRRRAEQFVRVLADDDAAVYTMLAELSDTGDLNSLAAGLISLARSETRELPPALHAQAKIRQEKLALLHQAIRDDPGALRSWLQRAAEEVLVVRSLNLTTRAHHRT